MATAVEFDFAARQERTIPVEAAAGACAAGKFCWVDLDLLGDRGTARATLRGLGLDARAVEAALAVEEGGHHEVFDDVLLIGVTAATLADGRLATSPVAALLSPSVLVTLGRGDDAVLGQVRRTYRRDFQTYAQSPGFLLYEFWDHLISAYRRAAGGLSGRVRRVQDELFGDVDDAIFGRVAGLTRDLLALRQAVVEATEVLGELCTRRSPAVPETTVPFLEKLVGRLERLHAGLTVEREALAEALNLYLGIVGHRTNKVVNRLTVVSFVFLPLTFLCGVYGMNFEGLPEYRWRHGYAYFWALAAAIAATTLLFMKRRGWW